MTSASPISEANLTDDRGPAMRSLLIAMIVLPTAVIILRFLARARLPAQSAERRHVRFWWDDWTALVAVAINIGVCGVGLKLVDLGLGKHIQTLPKENITPFLKLLWVEYYIFDTGTSVAKASALFFYARIFNQTQSLFKYALWTVHMMNVAWLIGILIAVILECSPIEKAWETQLPGRCDNEQLLWLSSGLPSLIIDVIILLLPLPILWKLRLKPGRKFLIICVFVCGYLVVVVSIGRLVSIFKAGSGLQDDPTYNIVIPVFWLGSEIAISIISISIPSIFSLVQSIYRKKFSSPGYTRSSSFSHRLISHGTDGSYTNRSDTGKNWTELQSRWPGTSTDSHVSAVPTRPLPSQNVQRDDSITSVIRIQRDISIG